MIGFTDSSYPDKWGTELCGIPIYSPQECLQHMEYDAVIVASTTGLNPIVQLCIELGVPEYKIITSYDDGSVKSRNIFLKNLAEILDGDEPGADVAEAGVFQGEFAKCINEYFPERVLHLFDTFEGFDEKDIKMEQAKSFSGASTGEYSGTSIDLVMKKMPHPEQCRIYKGYFPDTAKDVQSKFCFVNLDMDLYLPTYQGLHFFQGKMTDNGVILVHDYFSLHGGEVFKGVKAAVDQFVLECEGRIAKFPIGDGLSIMLAGRWTQAAK